MTCLCGFKGTGRHYPGPEIEPWWAHGMPFLVCGFSKLHQRIETLGAFTSLEYARAESMVHGKRWLSHESVSIVDRRISAAQKD